MIPRSCLAASWLVLVGGLTCSPGNAQEASAGIEVRVDLDQADAVMAILEKRSRGLPPSEDDWRRLESSEGYARLKRRQESFGAEDFDARFREYLLTDEPLKRLEELQDALVKWRSIDVSAARAKAQAYLPPATQVRATIYPVIKRTTNSFVFELDTDPAIFVYVDPDRSSGELSNILAHELHHVGSAACPEPEGVEALSPEARRVVSWLSAFGEGMAVLAAAGGPDVHPHASSPPEAWAIWERDVGEFATDLPAIEQFFTGVLAGKGSSDEQRAGLFSFISTEDVPQGGFYTVGWKMAALVERVQGRDSIVRAVCDPRVLLVAYNEVAAMVPRSEREPLPMWSEEFLSAISGEN